MLEVHSADMQQWRPPDALAQTRRTGASLVLEVHSADAAISPTGCTGTDLKDWGVAQQVSFPIQYSKSLIATCD